MSFIFYQEIQKKNEDNMPIGTPKIPVIRYYKDSENNDRERTVYITLYEKLVEERVLFLSRDIEFPLVNQLIALLLLMDSEEEKTIVLIINSRGGDALSTMALYDTMQISRSDVCTLNIGLAASGASLILVGGAIPRRTAFLHARVMIHQPSTAHFRAKGDKILLETIEMCDFRSTIAEIYAQKTGQPIDVIQKNLERDNFMSAEEAKDYGIIDHIMQKKKYWD